MPGIFENPRLTPAELAASEADTTYAAVAVVTLIATAGIYSCLLYPEQSQTPNRPATTIILWRLWYGIIRVILPA